jgi:hypothetical protein
MLRSITSIVGAAVIGASILITAGTSAKKALSLFRAESVPLARTSLDASPPDVVSPRAKPETNAADEERRQKGVLAEIIAEYPKSADGCPSRPPSEWINKRLKERGETWTVTPAAKRADFSYNVFVGPCNNIEVESDVSSHVDHNTLAGPNNNNIVVSTPKAYPSGSGPTMGGDKGGRFG